VLLFLAFRLRRRLRTLPPGMLPQQT